MEESKLSKPYTRNGDCTEHLYLGICGVCANSQPDKIVNVQSNGPLFRELPRIVQTGLSRSFHKLGSTVKPAELFEASRFAVQFEVPDVNRLNRPNRGFTNPIRFLPPVSSLPESLSLCEFRGANI